ncbi:MAG TPA: uracil-DNA glycosylase [Vicinamibacterales bacterium]|nr:uracil-DNA glycosylase [Vicinamibacterales bacterium]
MPDADSPAPPPDGLAAAAAHLRFFLELGVEGVRRDRWWRAPIGGPDDAISPEAERAGPPAAAPSVPAGSAAARLAEIRADIGDCTRCKLHALGRRQIVFGTGNPEADLMFVGEAPGQEEDLQGLPFVGRAGQLLTRMIEAIGLRREEVYIANVIKCRPPENRNPEPDEIATCRPFLLRQIDAIGPKVIVALGTVAARALLQTEDPISRLRGRVYRFRDASLVATYHPAFLLRSPDRKREAWADLQRVQALLRGEDA